MDTRLIQFYLLNAALLSLFLLSSAFMSAIEAAFFSLSHKQITHCKHSVDPADRRLLKLLKHPRRLLATILILNNLLNVAFATRSTYLLWHFMGNDSADNLAIALYTLISTALIVLVAEVIPKIYATQNNLLLAKRATTFMTLMVPLFYPLSSLMLQISSLFDSNIFQERQPLSVEELNRALELTATGETSHGEKEILRSVINFSGLTTKQVMQPRIEIEAVEIGTNFEQLMEFVQQSGHSRIPIYREVIDKIEGILYTKDLIPHLEQSADFEWQTLLRKPLFVPENKKVDALLLEFQERGLQIAIVVDEYGGTAGLVTLTDIMEEIRGEMIEDANGHEPLYQRISDHTFVVEGKISLKDFCKIIAEPPATFETAKGESETLAGLLLELHGRLPQAREEIYFQKFTFTILSADRRKIKKVRVQITPEAQGPVVH